MIELFGFQQTAAAQVADRYMEYADDPVLAGSARRPRTVPFFQALAALTGAGKTVVLAQAVAQISALTSTPPVVLWLSRGKVVVRQAFANLSDGGRYNHLLGGAAVEALGDYSPATVSDAAGPILYFATVGTFNQRDRSEGSLTIFKSDVDNTETSTWEALKARKTHSGTRRPLLVVYDEGHNLSDQQTELLLELEPDALLVASATMRLPARLAAEVDLLRRAGWSDEKLVTPVSASQVVSAGLVKSTLLLGGYNSPLEETLEAMLADMGAATAEAAALDLSFAPKAIYVCNTNVVADNAFQTDDPKEPFLRRQAPPILIWRFLTEHHGIDPADIAVYADLKTHSDAPLPDEFVLFKGADNDYEHFTAGNYRHIIFNLSLQEGWDDPSVYFAYVDKSMNSRAQVTQVVGRVLRQPDATHYDAPSLNSAHFYVRVDRNETFNEVIKEVSERLGSDLPAIRIISTSPGRQKPIEYMQRVDVSVPRTGINNARARAAVEEVMQTLPNYVGDERNVEGVGSRRIARQDVGASASSSDWESFQHASHVSVRWVLVREVRRRFQAALDVLNLADPRLDASVGVGSPAFAHVVRLAADVVAAYLDNVGLKQRRPNPYVVGPVLGRADELHAYEHSVHEGYSGLNSLEEAFAEAIDATRVTWCRNTPRSGYGIPLVSVGATDNFYPDFLIWTATRVICLDTKGPHLVAEAALRKLLHVEGQPSEPRQLDIQFVSKGTWDRTLQFVDSDGYTSWGLGPDGGLRVRPFGDINLLVHNLVADDEDDD